MSGNKELCATGSDAINAAVAAVYPGQQGRFFGTLIPWHLGGPDPLDSVGIWESDEGQPHWHYVTYGFSELYEKESDDPEWSGWGFELTFRLKRGGEAEPPGWPVSLLQNLARYVFSSGNIFGPGHHMSCNGPVMLGAETLLVALGFCLDPQLGEISTPNGRVQFLQAAAITEDEMHAMMCWDGQKFLAALLERLPLGVADLERPSLLDTPDFKARWRAGMAQDGSSCGFLYMDEVGLEQVNDRWQLRLGAGHVRILSNMLNARLGKGRELYLQGPQRSIHFIPGAAFAAVAEDKLIHLKLSPRLWAELCGVLASQPHAGVYPLAEGPLTLELAPTRITDQQGNVLRVIE